MISYKDISTVGTGLILVATSFIMGVFYSNQVYDYSLLFGKGCTQQHFDNALRHYQTMNDVAHPVFYVLCGIATLGLIGCTIRIYKPNPDLQLFEYCTLGFYVFGICVFITNIKTGVECSVARTWGEVTENEGLAVLASSNVILLLIFLGVIVLQAGLWYTRWEHQQRLDKFYAQEAAAEKVAAGNVAGENAASKGQQTTVDAKDSKVHKKKENKKQK